MSQPPLREIYATLAGTIDGQLVQRVFTAGAMAVNSQIQVVHLLIHSSGGVVNDGIALYNYLRRLPLQLVTYNIGAVESIAVLVFVAGQVRKASACARFAIHKSRIPVPHGATALELQRVAQTLRGTDDRTDAIIRAGTTIPLEEMNLNGQLEMSAQEALQFGLIHEIGDFVPVVGSQIIAV